MSSRWQRFFDSDVWFSFRTSPVAMVAALVALLCAFCAFFAPWVAPYDPFDLAALDLSDARLPPAWSEEGQPRYLLGTDDQGRDILSRSCTARASPCWWAWPRCSCRWSSA